MKKQIFVLLFLTLAAYAQQERIAIINTVDDYDSVSVANLTYLTDRLREVAVNILPDEQFGVMTTESIVAFLGSQENTVKVCKEASCLADLGKQVNADYVAQGRIGRFKEDLTINVELYNVKTGNLMGSFAGNSKDVTGLLALIDEKAADLFKRMIIEKPIVVEEPELAKMEPVPAKPEAPKAEKPSKSRFWIAVGLDVAGAAMLVAGYMKNREMNDTYKGYNVDEQSQSFYDKTWDEAENVRTQRNVFYIIGGVLLASGVGVHIWF